MTIYIYIYIFEVRGVFHLLFPVSSWGNDSDSNWNSLLIRGPSSHRNHFSSAWHQTQSQGSEGDLWPPAICYYSSSSNSLSEPAQDGQLASRLFVSLNGNELWLKCQPKVKSAIASSSKPLHLWCIRGRLETNSWRQGYYLQKTDNWALGRSCKSSVVTIAICRR